MHMGLKLSGSNEQIIINGPNINFHFSGNSRMETGTSEIIIFDQNVF